MNSSKAMSIRSKNGPQKVEDLSAIDKEMQKLNSTQYEAAGDDDRDEVISKLKSVNEMLREKVEQLEQHCSQVINQAKPKATYQRYWRVENPEFKKLDKELKQYKNKVESLRMNVQKESYDALALKNDLAESERKRAILEKDVKMLAKHRSNKNKVIKKLKNETEYEDKVSKVIDEIHKKRDEYKNVQEELNKLQKPIKDSHEESVKLQEDHATLKRKVIYHQSLKNHSDSLARGHSRPSHDNKHLHSVNSSKNDSHHFGKINVNQEEKS
jgi:chromosome segregation ATPase